MKHLVLVEYGDLTQEFIYCSNLKHAEGVMKHLTKVKEIEYLSIVVPTPIKNWSNPDCCSEPDFN